MYLANKILILIILKAVWPLEIGCKDFKAKGESHFFISWISYEWMLRTTEPFIFFFILLALPIWALLDRKIQTPYLIVTSHTMFNEIMQIGLCILNESGVLWTRYLVVCIREMFSIWHSRLRLCLSICPRLLYCNNDGGYCWGQLHFPLTCMDSFHLGVINTPFIFCMRLPQTLAWIVLGNISL